MLVPLQPQTMLSCSAAPICRAALGDPDAQAFVAAVLAKEQPPAARDA